MAACLGFVALVMAVLPQTSFAKGGRGANGCQASFAAAKAMHAVPAGQSQAQFMAYCASGILALGLTPLPQTAPITTTAPNNAAAGTPLALPPVTLPVVVPPLTGLGTAGTRAAAASAAAAFAGVGAPVQQGKAATVRRPVLSALPSPVPSTASLLPPMPVFNFGTQPARPAASAVQPVRVKALPRRAGKRRGG
jgi:hypothetical protein